MLVYKRKDKIQGKQLIRNQTNNYVRKIILSKYNNMCMVCSSKNNLQIHHKNYATEYYDIEHLTEDLCVMCVGCHRKEHKKIRLIEKPNVYTSIGSKLVC